MNRDLLKGSLNPKNVVDTVKYRMDFAKNNPDYFYEEGIMIFCGSQGSGKTLSAVQYIKKLCDMYPKVILVSNVEIFTLPSHIQVVEYYGLDSLKEIETGQCGVVYLIDEIHLELNSLESKNIDIDVMVELSQQRKQRKHIVGTTQEYLRMAKPLREQVKDVVLCEDYFKVLQHNVLINGFKSVEENGKLKAEIVGNEWWFHSPDLYNSYDTYAKMRRYKEEWKGSKKHYGSWD